MKMTNKNNRVGVYVPAMLYVLLLVIMAVFIPSSENRSLILMTMTTWSIVNIYCRWKKKFFYSFLISLLGAISLSSIMLAKDISFLAEVDRLTAETFGAAPGMTSRSIVGIAVLLAITLMNFFTDSFVQMMLGQSKGIQRAKELVMKTAGPVLTMGIMIGIGYVKNKTTSTQTEQMISFAQHVVNKDTGIWDVEKLPCDLLDQIKMFENAPLATGKIKASVIEKDPLKKQVIMQVGYGITSSEISEAIRLGFLPKGSTLPKRLTKKEAGDWFEKVTLRTYMAQVKEVLDPKIKITPQQLVALISFCHNLGKGNLEQLISQPGRLNDGNMEKTKEMIIKYINADGKAYDGLINRRQWEKGLL